MDNICRGLVHVVDDDASIRRSLDFLLRGAGYSVACWAGGEDFLGGADKAVPGCVLLDILMPESNGFEVQKNMIDQGFNFPVIVMTGQGNVPLTLQAMMAGAVDLLEKPFDRMRLLNRVAAAFDQLAGRISLRQEEDWARMQIAKLSELEREVLDGVACGYPNKVIADDLLLSPHRVEIYRSHVLDKLQVTFLADALRIALKAGLGAKKDWRVKHCPSGSVHRTVQRI